ncbi:superoxide dismutase [Chitinophaga sp.]|uniref:superoxide dismutase n=1 Tax=Chitinophaga sp. TaxID=1869181 RepID=UPI0031D0F7D5
MSTYKLEPLPYGYGALEPVIDTQTMTIHYSKHHQAYVDNLNKGLEGKPYADLPLEELFRKIGELPPVIRNNGGGHYNHSFFWPQFAAPAEREVNGELAAEIRKAFGSIEDFKTKFAEAAMTRFGSGWAWLIWSKEEQQLKITSTANQDNPLMELPEIVKGQPLLGLDVWEHAYYLHYQNKRVEYVANFWKIVNWDVINDRFAKAK